MKNTQGITLVALVITIIVLLILAVVALGVVRDSGIISHSQGASNKYKAGKEEEELKIAVMEAMLDGNGKFELPAFESGDYLPDGFVSNGDGTFTSASGQTFSVNGEGKVSLVETETPDGEDPVTPTVKSDFWSDLGVEVSGEELCVQYNKEYSGTINSTLLDEYSGLKININSDGGLTYTLIRKSNSEVRDYEIDVDTVTTSLRYRVCPCGE